MPTKVNSDRPVCTDRVPKADHIQVQCNGFCHPDPVVVNELADGTYQWDIDNASYIIPDLDNLTREVIPHPIHLCTITCAFEMSRITVNPYTA